MFLVIYHDHLDHTQILGEFDSLKDATELWKNCLKMAPEGYDFGYELVDNSNDEYETLEFEIVQELAIAWFSP